MQADTDIPPMPRRRWFLLGISPLPLHLLAVIAVVFGYGQMAPAGGAVGGVPAATLLAGTALFYVLLGAWVHHHRQLLPAPGANTWRYRLGWVLGLLLVQSAWGYALSAWTDPDGSGFADYARIFHELFSTLPMAVVLLFIVVIGPWFEELAYRKWMLSILPRAVGMPLAVLISGACFVLMHGPASAWQALGLGGLALLLSLLWLRTRSLTACWLLHAANNALACGALLAAA